MNKAQLVEAIADKVGRPSAGRRRGRRGPGRHRPRDRRGDRVSVTGFGSFEKVDRPARYARNPQTGERVRVKKTSVPRFRAGQGFKDLVSGSKKLPRGGEVAVKKAPKGSLTGGASATVKKAAAKKAADREEGRREEGHRQEDDGRREEDHGEEDAPRRRPRPRRRGRQEDHGDRRRPRPPRRRPTAKKAPAKKATAKKAPARSRRPARPPPRRPPPARSRAPRHSRAGPDSLDGARPAACPDRLGTCRRRR